MLIGGFQPPLDLPIRLIHRRIQELPHVIAIIIDSVIYRVDTRSERGELVPVDAVVVEEEADFRVDVERRG